MDPEPVLRALCTAYFPNLAKKQPGRPFFFQYLANRGAGHHSTSDGAMLSLFLHPSSALVDLLEGTSARGEIEWVI